MGESILIIKRKGSKINIKVTKKMRNGYAPSDFTRIINLDNYKDLALFLHDLNDLCGAPVDKAVKQYKLEQDNGWPF